MRCWIIFFSLFLSLVYAHEWAMIIVGSNSWYNYRHQADGYHARKILIAHGIPDERLIMFVYDDIAYNEQNPFPGNIINKPNGPNVYVNLTDGDYTGNEVTPQNFINALTGTSTIGKNLQSTMNDNVFLYFVDHGATGLFAFPSDVLYVNQLQEALMQVKAKSIVVYMESCESGSMFYGWLTPNTNIYGLSASTPSESSYACYWDSVRETYLGDVFSVNWLENADIADFTKETIMQQSILDMNETTTSTVCHYGNVTLAKVSKLSAFMGSNDRRSGTTTPKVPITDTVSSYRTDLVTAHRRLTKALTQDMKDVNITKLAIDLKRFNDEMALFMVATKMVQRTNPPKQSSGCSSDEKFDYECLRILTSKSQPLTVYDLEVISLQRVCSS